MCFGSDNMPGRGFKIPSLRVPTIEPSGTLPVGHRQYPIRVLVADDAPQLLRLLARVLRSKGLEVETAATASEALALVSGLGFDAGG